MTKLTKATRGNNGNWRAIAGIILALLLTGCGEPPVAQSLKRAQQEINAGNFVDGIKDLEHLLARAPQNTEVKEALAFAQLNNGDAGRAAELFNQLGLEKNSDDLLYAAQAFKKANQSERAIEAYRLYLLSEPNQSEPWSDLGELLIASHRTAEGIAALAKSSEIAPSAEISLEIGTLYAQNGNAAQAERYLQSSLKLSRAARAKDSPPSDTEGEALAQLAQLAVDNKKNFEAERHVKQLERDFPKHPKLAALKEKISPNSTMTSTTSPSTTPASSTIKPLALIDGPKTPVTPEPVILPPAPKPDPLVEAVGRDNQNVDRWLALARSKEKSGDDQGLQWAETAYLEAMRLKPADGAIIVAYLEVVKRRHSPSEFLDEAERQLVKYPEIPEIYLTTARGYRDLMQNKRNAGILFTRFLKKFPTHPEAIKVRAELDALK